MEANFIFPNVKAYAVSKADVKQGEVFVVELVDAEVPGNLKWFADNDPVLGISVIEGGSKATITALKPGASQVKIFDGDSLFGELEFSVYNEEAVSLNPEAGSPEPKES